MNIRALVLALSIAPVIALAAAQSEAASEENDSSQFRVINPEINAWAGGTISKAGDGELVVKGSNMPFLTARAQMHQEMKQKLAGIDDPQQRMQMAKQVKEAWRPKLEAAANQKKAEAADITFKAPADADDLVILDAKTVRELPFFQKMEKVKEAREKRGLEDRDLSKLYEAREERLSARAERRSERQFAVSADDERRKEAAEKIGEKAKERAQETRDKLAGQRLKVTDLKAGDKVIIGYNAKNNTVFTIVQSDAKE